MTISKGEQKLAIGNLKMNFTNVQERDRYLGLFKKQVAQKKFDGCEIILCPSYVHLEGFKKANIKKVSLGAQNMFPEPKGSYTGEISPLMLKSYGCEYVIIGHSERRRYQAESGHEINLKLISALKHGLKPILCVGERLEEKENNYTLEVVTRQVREALNDVSRGKIGDVTIAYEPVWSVGSDDIPSSNEIMGAKLLIRKILVEIFGKKYAEKVRIVYGGSANVRTLQQVCLEPGMDGVLVGRESLLPVEFVKMAEMLNNK